VEAEDTHETNLQESVRTDESGFQGYHGVAYELRLARFQLCSSGETYLRVLRAGGETDSSPCPW
jgi:hypothetical protein